MRQGFEAAWALNCGVAERRVFGAAMGECRCGVVGQWGGGIFGGTAWGLGVWSVAAWFLFAKPRCRHARRARHAIAEWRCVTVTKARRRVEAGQLLTIYLKFESHHLLLVVNHS